MLDGLRVFRKCSFLSELFIQKPHIKSTNMEPLCAKQFLYIMTPICGIYYSTVINTEYQMGLLFESPFSV